MLKVGRKKWERVLGVNGKKIGENQFYSLSILKVEEESWNVCLEKDGKRIDENRFYSLEYFKSGRK
jgi:hypothetical protein